MFTERSGKQSRLEMVILEDLVPKDHLLRKIEKAIDFSFINKICKPYYSENNGRPAIEPEVLFRMLFIGYLYGIRSEIRLLKEIEVQVKTVLHDDVFIGDVVHKYLEYQQQENTAIPYLEKNLSDTQRSIDNLIAAIEQGIITPSTKQRLETLEVTKRELRIRY